MTLLGPTSTYDIAPSEPWKLTYSEAYQRAVDGVNFYTHCWGALIWSDAHTAVVLTRKTLMEYGRK